MRSSTLRGWERRRLERKPCAGHPEDRAAAIARTKRSQGAAARTAARQDAAGDASKLRKLDMAERRSEAKAAIVELRKGAAGGGEAGAGGREEPKRPIADRARALGDLVRAVGRVAGAQAFLGERTETCRSLVPLGLPPMAGLSRRPVFLAGKHTDWALKKLISTLGGSWRKWLGGGAASGVGRRGAFWGESVGPCYEGRPAPLW